MRIDMDMDTRREEHEEADAGADADAPLVDSWSCLRLGLFPTLGGGYRGPCHYPHFERARRKSRMNRYVTSATAMGRAGENDAKQR